MCWRYTPSPSGTRHSSAARNFQIQNVSRQNCCSTARSRIPPPRLKPNRQGLRNPNFLRCQAVVEDNDIFSELEGLEEEPPDIDLLEDIASSVPEAGYLDFDENHRSGYIALIGLPNAGKSTLMNSLVGQKLSIVTRKAQTTRHRILGLVSDDDFQAIFFDTPGVITRMETKLDEKMMLAVRQAVDESDALITLIDLTDDPKLDLEMIQPPENWTGPPMAVVLNKKDLVSDDMGEELKQWYEENCRADKVFLTNAKAGDGIDEVKNWAVENLPKGPPLYPKDMVSDNPEKFFVAELIREKIFLQYRQEVPYSIQVNVLDFRERQNRKDYIVVEIIVERDTQKGIVIGKKGLALKQLASAARADVEEFLGRPVYLDVCVSVKKDWRKSDRLLDQYGY